MEIRTTDRDVATALARVVDLAVSHGVVVHPSAWVEEHDGHIGVHAGLDARRGTPLVELPAQLLVPIDGARWEVHGDDLVLVQPDPSWTDIQQQLATAITDVYCVTSKVDWARSALPWFALHDRPDLVATLRRLRPGFPERRPDLADAFVGTRTLGRGDARVLMPVIDWFDHHAHAPQLHGNDSGLTVRVRRLGDGSSCRVRYYNNPDPLDLALAYGFVDLDTTCVCCAPLTVDVDGFGAVMAVGSRAPVPFRVDPPRVDFDGETLRLDNLLFDAGRPDDLVDLLTMPLTAIGKRRTTDAHDTGSRHHRLMALRIVRALATAHRALVSETMATFEASPSGDALVMAALERHLVLIDRLLHALD